MTVIKFVSASNPSLVSYQFSEISPAELTTLMEQADQPAYIEAHATIAETVTEP